MTVLTSVPSWNRCSMSCAVRVDSADAATNASLSSAAARWRAPCSGASPRASTTHAVRITHRVRRPVASCASRSILLLADREFRVVLHAPGGRQLQGGLEAALVPEQGALDRRARLQRHRATAFATARDGALGEGRALELEPLGRGLAHGQADRALVDRL